MWTNHAGHGIFRLVIPLQSIDGFIPVPQILHFVAARWTQLGRPSLIGWVPQMRPAPVSRPRRSMRVLSRGRAYPCVYSIEVLCAEVLFSVTSQ